MFKSVGNAVQDLAVAIVVLEEGEAPWARHRGAAVKPTLVILAAGVGSRYGGLKQLDPVGPGGAALMDYTMYDAIRGGFGRVVLVIRRETEAEIRTHIEAGAARTSRWCLPTRSSPSYPRGLRCREIASNPGEPVTRCWSQRRCEWSVRRRQRR